MHKFADLDMPWLRQLMARCRGNALQRRQRRERDTLLARLDKEKETESSGRTM